MNAIFESIKPNSLLLLNEPLQSTSAAGSYHLASDVIRILKKIGIRTLFSTHLHELARGISEMNNAENGEGRIISLVAQVDSNAKPEGGHSRKIRPNFKILPGIPEGRSYSEEIARKYGFSYDKLLKVFKKRGMLI
jgi:DNA mismatch repair ATPase MutS